MFHNSFVDILNKKLIIFQVLVIFEMLPWKISLKLIIILNFTRTKENNL